MIDWLIFLLSWALTLVACVFIITGAVGLIRLPDLYARLHAASVTDTGGTIFLVAALALQAVFVFGNGMAAIKVVLIMFFTLFTSPTASHALAKTALLSGHVPVGADGKPILASPEEASRLARSRPDRRQPADDGTSSDQGGEPPANGPLATPHGKA